MLFIGGVDVNKRIDLMQALARDFDLSAAGSRRELARDFSVAGFPYVDYPLERGTNPLRDTSSLLALRRLIKRQRPDVVHAFATKPAVWGRIAARMEGVPCVVGTLPGLGSLYAANGMRTRVVRPVYQVLQKLACNVSDVTVFYNHGDSRRFRDAGIVPIEKSMVLPGSGVRTDVYDRSKLPPSVVRSVREEIGVRDGGLVITMIGRVIRTKGVMEFAEAAERIKKRLNGEISFVLVGPDDRDSIDRLSSEELKRLSKSLTWIGERREIGEILACSDVFVLPSYREGIPRVLMEAASMGLPLVTTKAPGCEDVVEDGVNGLLVPPEDTPALTSAIQQLIDGPDLRRRFGAAARQTAVSRFDLSAIARRMADLYRQLLSSKGLSWNES